MLFNNIKYNIFKYKTLVELKIVARSNLWNWIAQTELNNSNDCKKKSVLQQF